MQRASLPLLPTAALWQNGGGNRHSPWVQRCVPLANPLGRALADLYYRLSPALVEFTTKDPTVKRVVRAGLVPAVAMATIATNTSSAEKTAVLVLLVLVSVGVATWTTRRQGRAPQHTQTRNCTKVIVGSGACARPQGKGQLRHYKA